MAHLFIAASPLVKLFLPEWHDRLMDNPDLLFDKKTEFSFNVNRGSSSIVVQFNKPMQVPAHLARDEKEMLNCFNWLTGGPEGNECQETNWTGISVFDPKVDLTSAYDEILALAEDEETGLDPEAIKARQKKALKKQQETAKRVAEARTQVLNCSDRRIREVLRNMYNNLYRQWQINEESKLGKYPPSMTEKLAMFVLDADIQKAQKKGEALNRRANELLQSTTIV